MRFKSLAITLLVVAAVTVTGCAKALPGPAAVVQSLLELRAHNSTDASAYAKYVAESSVATALAQGTAPDGAKRPIPEWFAPVVESSSETSAVVLVKWKPDSAHKGWPAATRFVMANVGGHWLMSDALDATSRNATPTPTPELKRKP